MKKTVSSLLLCASFVFFLVFPQRCTQAAASGLLLWYKSLVPALFPAMIISKLLLSSNLAYYVIKPVSAPFRALLGLSPYGVYALFAGFLFGCPMGAKTVSDMYRDAQISQTEACYLASFCNNLSPAFLINFLVLEHLQSETLLLPTLVILYGAPLLYALFANSRYRQAQNHLQPAKNKTSPTAISFAMVDVCIMDSILRITKLGGYVILFSVWSAAAEVLPLPTPLFAAVLSAITEVSGGIHKTAILPLTFSHKYLLLIAAASFGGFCCMAQSARMLADIGLRPKNYLRARLAITAVALIMAICYVM